MRAERAGPLLGITITATAPTTSSDACLVIGQNPRRGTAPTSDPIEVGRVMGQSPPVGAVVPVGAQVTVIGGQAERTDAHSSSVWQAPVREVERIEPMPTPHARPSS
jgi:hypothetical protein